MQDLKDGPEHTARGITQACGSPWTRVTRLCNRGSIVPVSTRAIHGLWLLSAYKLFSIPHFDGNIATNLYRFPRLRSRKQLHSRFLHVR